MITLESIARDLARLELAAEVTMPAGKVRELLGLAREALEARDSEKKADD